MLNYEFEDSDIFMMPACHCCILYVRITYMCFKRYIKLKEKLKSAILNEDYIKQEMKFFIKIIRIVMEKTENALRELDINFNDIDWSGYKPSEDCLNDLYQWIETVKPTNKTHLEIPVWTNDIEKHIYEPIDKIYRYESDKLYAFKNLLSRYNEAINSESKSDFFGDGDRYKSLLNNIYILKTEFGIPLKPSIILLMPNNKYKLVIDTVNIYLVSLKYRSTDIDCDETIIKNRGQLDNITNIEEIIDISAKRLQKKYKFCEIDFNTMMFYPINYEIKLNNNYKDILTRYQNFNSSSCLHRTLIGKDNKFDELVIIDINWIVKQRQDENPNNVKEACCCLIQ